MRLLGLIVLVGCSGGKGGDHQDSAVDPFGRFINVTTPPTGNFDCFTPSADAASATWLTGHPDVTMQTHYPVSGLVEDFQEATPLPGATVALYGSDVVAGTPDATGTSDTQGNLAIDANACSPMTYKVTTEGGPVATKTTYKAHQIYGYPATGTIEGATFVSVSDVTYQLIPSILGIEVQPDLAIIAGTAYDCTRDPAQETDDPVGKIENVQVVVYDADGNIPDTLSVNYFIESFPARDLDATSADGLWVAANVPPGDLTVEMWGDLNGELVLLGRSNLRSEADSINIANVFAGYGDGVKYPANCEKP